MSLTGKQVRELQSLYESMYEEKPQKEDIILTQEEFDQVCLVILAEAFKTSEVELFEGRPKITMMQKGYKHIVKPAIDYVKNNKFQLGATAGLTGAGTYDGGVNVKHLGAMVKNARDFIGGTRQMVNKDTEGAGMLQVDKDTGRIDSTKKDKNIKNDKNEQFNMKNIEAMKGTILHKRIELYVQQFARWQFEHRLSIVPIGLFSEIPFCDEHSEKVQR